MAIFDPTTSAGLLQIVENYPNDIVYSTANFLKAFNDIWKILNIKTPFKHVYKNDPISKPFSDPEDSRLTELESFTTTRFSMRTGFQTLSRRESTNGIEQ